MTLDLTGTKVTPQGIADLKKALPNCEIEWEPPKAEKPVIAPEPATSEKK